MSAHIDTQTASVNAPSHPTMRPALGANASPMKALAGGLLVGVVLGGFVSPMAAKLSIPFSTAQTTSASPVQISSSAVARAVIQDARAATGDGANPAALSTDAGQQPVKLSNAGGETDR
jgi:hypothetical protein